MADFPYRHIIWDWNGTLLDDAWLCVEALNGQLSKRGLPPIDAGTYETLFDFPVKDFYQRLDFDFMEEPFEAVSAEWMEIYEQRVEACQLRADARQALERARTMGLSQSILSAAEQGHLQDVVTRYGLLDYFGDVVGADDHHAHGKAARGLAWLADSAVDPEKAVFIGDTAHDAEVAEALGVPCVLIHSGHQSRERLARTGAPVIDSLTAIFNGAQGSR